jgi:hypothetical protein
LREIREPAGHDRSRNFSLSTEIQLTEASAEKIDQFREVPLGRIDVSCGQRQVVNRMALQIAMSMQYV